MHLAPLPPPRLKWLKALQQKGADNFILLYAASSRAYCFFNHFLWSVDVS